MTTLITDKQVTDALVEVRQLLTPPGSWIQDGYAGRLDEGGVLEAGLEPENPVATCWCLDGALMRVAGAQRTVDDDPQRAALLRVLVEVVAKHINPADGSRAAAVIHDWNDDVSRTRTQVLDTLDDLISKRRARESR